MHGGVIFGLFERRILLVGGILFVPSLDQVEGIGPENPIKFLLNQGVFLLIKDTLEYLRDKVNHSLKKILVLEDHLALAVTQEYAHVHITDFLALFLEMVGFVSEFL